MRIAVLSPGYPSEEAPYNYAFVHARTRLYAAAGHDVAIFTPGSKGRYELDGLPVTVAPPDDLPSPLRAFRPDVLAIHAPSFRTIPVARRIECRQVSWVHGHEALFSLRGVDFGRTRRERLLKWAKVVPRNLWQLYNVRDFLIGQQAVIFVSRWMKEAAERHTLRHYPNGRIIPNPVDTDLFSYRLDPERRYEGVTTRSLNSTKYGIDVAVRAFARVREASLTVVGRGSLEPTYRRLIGRTRSRTTLVTRYVPHREMPALLGGYGFFVAPSRVEAQGVAMCEAMACGLPVVATTAGGIPEFVTDGVEGLLVPPEDPKALGRAVDRLVSDPDLHRALSRAARSRMEAQCSPPVVVAGELAALEGRT